MWTSTNKIIQSISLELLQFVLSEMKENSNETINFVSYLDVSEFIIKEPSPLLQPSPMQHDYHDFLFELEGGEVHLNYLLSFSSSVSLFFFALILIQILSPEDHFELESIEVNPSDIVLTPITSGLIRMEVQDFMEDFKLDREQVPHWSEEEPRRHRGDRMRMHKTPTLQLFRLESDLDRIVEYDEQSYASQLCSLYSSFSEKPLDEDNCCFNSNTFYTVFSKKSQSKDTFAKDIEVQNQTTVEPTHVDYTDTISKFTENPRAQILAKLQELQSLRETPLIDKQTLLKKFLENYLLEYEVFCYEESWKELGKCKEETFDLIREGVIETFDKMVGSLSFQTRRVKLLKYLEKKRRRIWKKKVSYDCRKKVADGRLRIKGKFVTREQACQQLGLESLDNFTPEQIKEMLQKRLEENLKQLSC